MGKAVELTSWLVCAIKDNNVYLCVMELKDENKSSEPMSVVLQQALAYAVFVAQLLDSPCGHKWWKLFGFNKEPKKRIIDVVGLMPKGESKEIYGNKEFEVGSFVLKLHTLYFDKNKLLNKEKFEFSGDYPNSLLAIGYSWS